MWSVSPEAFQTCGCCFAWHGEQSGQEQRRQYPSSDSVCVCVCVCEGMFDCVCGLGVTVIIKVCVQVYVCVRARAHCSCDSAHVCVLDSCLSVIDIKLPADSPEQPVNESGCSC